MNWGISWLVVLLNLGGSFGGFSKDQGIDGACYKKKYYVCFVCSVCYLALCVTDAT